MTVVARKFVAAKSTLWITATLCELVAIAFVVGMARNTNVSEFFWFIPFAIAILFMVGPLVVWIGLSELRKNGVVMFLDRDGVSWEWSGAFFFFWRPIKTHYHRLKWDDILGANVVRGTVGEYQGNFVIIGVRRCEWLTRAQLKSSQEFVLTNLGRPPWKSTLAIMHQGEWNWNPQEIVAQIEETIRDKTLREQWGEPQFDGGEMSVSGWAYAGPIRHRR